MSAIPRASSSIWVSRVVVKVSLRSFFTEPKESVGSAATIPASFAASDAGSASGTTRVTAQGS